ncbi:hypothetical protein [Corallococcus carmarthensis]|uniref:Uncharacterized protein n=1 Tax=Corallococcus carmarthensis TaxID=2316728 RepID=A0A3A8JKG8_9BACT|nr:hypothetical protein [Corallococcus carmarthensis]NOK18192.1 hypothetical protein [Corallococcus carmarthensis]RKG95835.1 hypothetical protein D7X32_37865 [Corallococcus carmarthensis]
MSRHSFHAFVLSGVLGWGLAGVPAALASDVQSEQSQQGLRVTYLLYSGRPNPVVLVTDPGQVRAIEEQLDRILASGERVTKAGSPALLGYTGIQIERLGDAGRHGRPLVLRGDVLSVKADPAVAATSSQVTVSREAVGLESLLLELGQSQKMLGDMELSVIRQTR